MKRNLFESASAESTIFRNESYLSQEFVPERLPHRDEQINSLVYSFSPILKGGKPHNLFVYGKTGVGKTVTVKYVLNELQEHSDKVKVHYINCFEFNSRSSVLTEITNFLGSALPRRGIGTDEIYAQLIEALRKSPFTPVLILDESDQLLLRADGSKLFYDLLRVVEHCKKHFGLVFISNVESFLAQLDARVKSSLTEERIDFLPYSPQQLKDILNERAEFAFMQNVLGKDVVNVAAAHAAKLGGDARVAIESLWKAGRIAERENSKTVELRHLKEAFGQIELSKARKEMKFLNPSEKALLAIISSSQPLTTGKLYEKYSVLSKKPLSLRSIRAVITRLEVKGIISALPVSSGDSGRTREITLTLSKELVDKALAE